VRLIWLDLVNRARRLANLWICFLCFIRDTWIWSNKLQESKANISDLIPPLPCSIRPNAAVSSPQLMKKTEALTSHYLIFKVEKALTSGARICHISKRLFCASNCSLEIPEELTHMAQMCAPALVLPLPVRIQRPCGPWASPGPIFLKRMLLQQIALRFPTTSLCSLL